MAEGAEVENCSRQDAKHILSEVEGNAKKKYFLTCPNLAAFAPLREIF